MHCIFSINQVFEQSGVQLMADSQYDAQTRIQVLLEYLHDREIELEDSAEQKRTKLDQCVQLRHLETEAKQVITPNYFIKIIIFNKKIVNKRLSIC